MVIGMVLDPMVCTVLQLHRMAHEIFTCLFTDLLKSDSFIMPVWNNCTCWSDFCEVLYWGGFLLKCVKIQFYVKSDKVMGTLGNDITIFGFVTKVTSACIMVARLLVLIWLL